MINISSIAGRQAWANYGVRNLTKFGVNGFTESLRQELAQRHVRVSVLEPGAVDTELGSHNKTPSTPRSSNRSTRGTSARPRRHRRRDHLYRDPAPTCLDRRTLGHAHRPSLTAVREGVSDEARITGRARCIAHRPGSHDHGRHLHDGRRPR
ncbi:SDR family NAD(P)-dependent oxidoreductase [Streptomyces sp. NPDC056937]|uniref:SDR family NAD(P)-dependent oxidoreductase n=1 Tax=Streptomyces sp. NPDC056937 TaxID=3345969 RepID=UPI00363DFEC0